MKRTLFLVTILLSGLVLTSHVAAQQRRSARPKKTGAKTLATVKPLNVDGEWHGTTSQGREISLVVKSNTIVLYKVAYGIPSRGCFIVPEVNGATKVTWDETSPYAPKVTENRLKISQPSTSGGINASPISYLNGSFSATGTLSGSISFTAVTRAGEPLCQSQIEVTFSADKVGSGAVEGASSGTQQRTAEKILAEIAKTDKDENIRKAAVEKLTDPAILAEIAASDPSETVRLAIVSKLTDQNLLARIAKSEKDRRVGVAAAEKLTDQALLAELAKTASKSGVRWTAVEKLTDQTLLAELAKTATEAYMGPTAVEKLTDQALLVQLAKTASRSDVRSTAVEKLTDQTLIAEIAKRDSDGTVRRRAVRQLGDQKTLGEIAENDSDGDVRDEAIEKLTDPVLLTRIAKTEGSAFVDSLHGAISRNVTDPALLAEIAKTARKEFVREAAIEKLTDQSLLAEIAASDPAWTVRRTIVNKLTDPTLLARIAKSDPSALVRCQAVEKLTDESILTDIAKNDSDGKVREIARRLAATTRPFETVILTFIGVDRVQSWIWPGARAASKAGNRGLEAMTPTLVPRREDMEIAVVRLKVTASPSYKAPLNGACSELIDVNGKRYKSGMSVQSMHPALDFECPFVVPKGAEFKTFRMNGLTFDLSKQDDIR